MTFTDDDLKRLKVELAKCKDFIDRGISPLDDSIVEVDFKDLDALLSRLEAAEKDRDMLHKAILDLIESDMNEDIDMDALIEIVDAYEKRRFPIGRKACGKGN